MDVKASSMVLRLGPVGKETDECSQKKLRGVNIRELLVSGALGQPQVETYCNFEVIAFHGQTMGSHREKVLVCGRR